MKKKPKSTYELFIEDKRQKELLDKEYKKLLMSELLIIASNSKKARRRNSGQAHIKLLIRIQHKDTKTTKAQRKGYQDKQDK